MTSIPRSWHFCEKPSNKLRTKVTFHSEISRYALSTWIKQMFLCSAKIGYHETNYLQKWIKSSLKLYALILLQFCFYIWLHKSVLWAILLSKKFDPEIFFFSFFGFLMRPFVNIFEPITLNVKPFQPSNAFICSSKLKVTSSYSPQRVWIKRGLNYTKKEIPPLYFIHS